jgi:Putative zinc-finger
MEPEFKTSACLEFEPLLEDCVSGDLGGAEAKNLADHLKSCAGCRVALEEARLAMRLTGAAEPAGDPGPAFARVVMARIQAGHDRETAEGSYWQPFVTLAWRFAGTAALVLVMLLTYDARLHSQPQPAVASARTGDVHELFSDPSRPPASRDEVLWMMTDVNHGQK